MDNDNQVVSLKYMKITDDATFAAVSFHPSVFKEMMRFAKLEWPVKPKTINCEHTPFVINITDNYCLHYESDKKDLSNRKNTLDKKYSSNKKNPSNTNVINLQITAMVYKESNYLKDNSGYIYKPVFNLCFDQSNNIYKTNVTGELKSAVVQKPITAEFQIQQGTHHSCIKKQVNSLNNQLITWMFMNNKPSENNAE